MLRRYSIEEGTIHESSQEDCAWLRITEPKECDITEAAQVGFDPVKLSAALDSDEPSQFDYDGSTTYLLIDIPYKDATGKFNTTPLMIATSSTHVVTVSGNDDSVVNRLLTRVNTDKDNLSNKGLALRLLLAANREYQSNLKEIDAKRHQISATIRKNPRGEEILALHDLESSLVYMVTSLKSLNLVLRQLRVLPVVQGPSNSIYKKILVENQQAIEMATTYREILDSTRELATATIDNQLNNTMKWLTGATIVLTIPMIITGAYGMNVSLPMESASFAFAAIVGVTASICAATVLYLRKKKIL